MQIEPADDNLNEDNLTELLRALAAVMRGGTQGGDNEERMPSVTLKTTAKGETQVEVKCYHSDIFEAARLAEEVYRDQITKWGVPGQQ